MAEKQNEIARREESGVTSRDAFLDAGRPFRALDHFVDEVNRVFDDFGLGRGWLSQRPAGSPRPSKAEAWMPEVEVFHRDYELVVRADLPGVSKDDVKVDVAEDRLTIQGERKWERDEEREGLYRSERSYGRFYRGIRLPEGTITDQAKATFRNGVLEITMPAPPEHARRGRRLEIADAAPPKK
jgi:HSP20 family protein